MEKFHYMREGDCRTCRTGGGEVTRGREGKGRYAKEMNKRHSPDVSGGASPWAQSPTSSRREKEWHSPTRREADSAWEDEHSSRIEDLQTRVEKLSVASHSPPRPVESPEPLSNRHDSPEPDHDRRSRRRDKLFAEVSGDNYSASTRRKRDSRSRHEPNDSYESFDSIPSRHRSGPLRTYSYKDDPYDSGYASHSSYRSPRDGYSSHRPGLTHSQSAGLHGYGAKTEPRSYAYSLPRSRTFDNYAGYSSPLNAYGVELSPSGQARLISRRY